MFFENRIYRSQRLTAENNLSQWPEEDEQINIAVSLTGMTKQDFIFSKLLDRTIYVQASCKVHRAVYDRLTEVLEQLTRLSNASELDDELEDNILLVSGIIDELYIKSS